MISLAARKEDRILLGGGLGFLTILGLGLSMDLPILISIPPAVLTGLWLCRDIRLLFFALVASLPFSFNLEESTRINLDFPDEALMLVLTLGTVLFLLLNGRRIAFRRWLQHPLVLTMLVTLAWTTVTVIFSENVPLSLKYLLKKIWFLIPFLFLPSLLFREEHTLRRSVQGLVSGITVVAGIVLIRFSAVGFRFELVHDPMQPFFINHVSFGSMVACLTPVAVAGLLLSRKLSLQWIFSLLAIGLLVSATYLSYSRAAWMSLLFAAFAWAMVRFRLMHYAMLGFYVCLGVLVFWLSQQNRFLDYKPKFEKTIMHESLEDHILATIQGTDISSAERYYRWIAAVRMSADRPLMGVGPNNFYDFYKAYTVSSFRTWVSRNHEKSTTHNYFLFMLVEQGIPAMLLYAWLIFLIFYQGQKIFARSTTRFDRIAVQGALGVVAAVFVNNFFSELIESDKIGSLFFLALAVLVAIDLKNRQEAAAHA